MFRLDFHFSNNTTVKNRGWVKMKKVALYEKKTKNSIGKVPCEHKSIEQKIISFLHTLILYFIHCSLLSLSYIVSTQRYLKKKKNCLKLDFIKNNLTNKNFPLTLNRIDVQPFNTGGVSL
jgi:hypothetical protein